MTILRYRPGKNTISEGKREQFSVTGEKYWGLQIIIWAPKSQDPVTRGVLESGGFLPPLGLINRGVKTNSRLMLSQSLLMNTLFSRFAPILSPGLHFLKILD